MESRTLIVLDTHAVIWYAGGFKLRRPAIVAIESSLNGAGVVLSAISAWEIGMLVAKARLTVAGAVDEYVHSLFHRGGIFEEPVSARIGVLAASLSELHGDPADRIIVATAVLLRVPLVTRDERITAYLRATKMTPVIRC